MKRIILVAMVFLVFTSFMSLNAQWARTYGGDGDEYGVAIQQTSDGGYILAGDTSSFGAGSEDIWILKLSSTGTIDWQNTYGGSSDDIANSIQQTSDGGYIVAGRTYSFGAGQEEDIWILKLSSTGTVDWQHTYGGSSDDIANSIQQTSDGGYIVAGRTYSFGAGEWDIWVLKLSSTGTIDWQKTYGGSDTEEAQSIQQTSDGGYIVAGYTKSFTGLWDFWVLKLSSTGTIDWQHTYEGSLFDMAQSIQQTSDGGYIVAGRTYSFGAGEWDIWVLKLSSTGTIDWQNTYGGSSSEEAQSIQQTSDGGYIVAGYTSSFGAGLWDFWVLKLSSTGTIDWQNTYGGSSIEAAQSIQQTSDGGYILAGYTFSFGAGGIDFLVLKLNSDGDIDPSCGFIGTSNASVLSTSVPPVDTNITPEDTYVTPLVTNISPQDTNASVIDICQEFNLTISASAGGTTDQTPGDYIYSYGTQVSITAIPDIGYRFSEWTGDAPSGLETDNPITIIMNSDKSITANFVQKYTLFIEMGTGGGTDPIAGSYDYDPGTQVSITAIPDIGYRFSEWTGDVPSGLETDNPITITMDSDKSITANFVPGCMLTIVAGTGGTTNPSPGTYTHDSGAQVIVQAVPSSGYQFSGWSGSVSGTTNPITITMDSDKYITANFTQIPSDGDDGGKGGGCFIATAAYGSPLHPHIDILRNFRDKYFMPNKLGDILVNLYYKYSPYFANLIAKHKALKVVVRINLLPFVVFSYSMLHFGPIITVVLLVFIFIFPIFLILFFRRKMRQVETKKPKAWLPRF